MENFWFHRRLPSPTGVFAFVVPSVDVFACGDSVTYEVRVAVVTDFFVADYPSSAWVHVCLQFDHFFG